MYAMAVVALALIVIVVVSVANTTRKPHCNLHGGRVEMMTNVQATIRHNCKSAYLMPNHGDLVLEMHDVMLNRPNPVLALIYD